MRYCARRAMWIVLALVAALAAGCSGKAPEGGPHDGTAGPSASRPNAAASQSGTSSQTPPAQPVAVQPQPTAQPPLSVSPRPTPLLPTRSIVSPDIDVRAPASEPKKFVMSATKSPGPAAPESTMPLLAEHSPAVPPPPPEVPATNPAETAGSEPPSSDAGQAAVVKVYYATDRAHMTPAELLAASPTRWLVWALAAAGVTLILLAFAVRHRSHRLWRWTTGAAAAVALLVAATAAYSYLSASNDAASGARAYYGGQRGDLELGTCTVTIPKNHRVGELESPSVWKLQLRADPGRHVVLTAVEPQPAEDFYRDLRECVGRSQAKAAFVFIHGYNVTFDDAARRTAQVAHDLNYDGAPIFYSWPSQGKLRDYTVDETNVEWTVPHLRQFLLDVAQRCGAEQVHLIAHSMGNRALTGALRRLAFGPNAAKPLFREVILTAPDIDAEVFKDDLAPAIVRTANRVTLYASSNDEALALSKQLHGSARAGESGREMVVVPGIDTIDVSAVDTSLVGHSYYGSNDTVLADLFDLIHESKPPDQRRWLHPERVGALTYWVFTRR